MSRINIVKEIDVKKTPRVMQLEGIFDIPPSQKSIQEWNVDIEIGNDWNIGLIVGPSGCGKTTIARELFGDNIISSWDWPDDLSILDGFPKEMSIKDIVDILSSVGFSSPPSWMRPFRVLSNGEQFRANMARSISENNKIIVIDEFTSVVDRTVAQIGSAAIQKTIRARNKKFIAVSCHYDIMEWLEPDWVYQPHTNTLYTGRWLHQRPKVCIEIKRVHYSAWEIFRKHHYLDTSINKASVCFCAFINDNPVAFTSVLHFPHPKSKNIKRGHRTVCLPDYQGIGIGNALSAFIGSVVRGIGCEFISITSHPAMIRSRNKSNLWKMIASPNIKTKTMKNGISGKQSGNSGAKNRMRATFRYIGPALDADRANKIFYG